MKIRADEKVIIVGTSYNGTAATITSTEHIFIDTTKYSGSVTYFLEVVGQVTAGASGSIRLRRNGTTTDDATITISSLGATSTLVRSASFTPNAGGQDYFLFADSAGASKTLSMWIAKVVVLIDTSSSDLTANESSIELGDEIASTSTTGVTTGLYWKYDSNNWDGTITARFEAVMNSSSTKVTTTAQLQVADGTGDGFVNWANVTNAVATTTSITSTRVRAASDFALTTGRNYRVIVTTTNSKSAVTLHNAKVIITQSGTITKFENQYWFGNSFDISATGAQNDLNKWDTTEWSGVTNTYKGVIDAINNSTSVTAFKTSSGVTTLGTVSSPDNQGMATLAMPTSQNLDINPSSNDGINAARIIVLVVGTAAAVATNYLTLLGVGT
jgi:hypothetical protein